MGVLSASNGWSTGMAELESRTDANDLGAFGSVLLLLVADTTERAGIRSSHFVRMMVDVGLRRQSL